MKASGRRAKVEDEHRSHWVWVISERLEGLDFLTKEWVDNFAPSHTMVRRNGLAMVLSNDIRGLRVRKLPTGNFYVTGLVHAQMYMQWYLCRTVVSENGDYIMKLCTCKAQYVEEMSRFRPS